MESKKTIHLIFKAHIDPIWLWPWTSGLDEVLATCRSACDRLDAHPDIYFTRGEAWAYQQVQHCDPALFERMRKHIAAGRWEIVGGWWVQPDCNFPSGRSFEKQIELGKAYFQLHFGSFPRIAFNPDSFGHHANIPALLTAAGQDTYVFMRPQPQQKTLPARLFRWRGREGGPEVLGCRISGYGTFDDVPPKSEWMDIALENLPDGIDDAMCFLGLSNHGGGPTERLIAACRDLMARRTDIRIIFSTMARYFDTVRPRMNSFPLVTGELEYVSIGCYSVQRQVKLAVRRAENLLERADLVADDGPGAKKSTLQAGWEKLCLHQFHDTLGGTCLPSAYVPVLDQLGMAAAAGEEALQYTLRRRLNGLPDDPHQRMVFWNASDQRFDGWTETELWRGSPPYPPAFEIVDEKSRPVAFQEIPFEAIARWNWTTPRILLRQQLESGQMSLLRMRPCNKPPQFDSRVAVGDQKLTAKAGTECDLAGNCLRLGGVGGLNIGLPRLELFEDRSDTWGNNAGSRFSLLPHGQATWHGAGVFTQGPLMASLVRHGAVGNSPLRAEWRVYGQEDFVELRLRVIWNQRFEVLKLIIPSPQPLAGHIAGIPGGLLERPNYRGEVPIRDWLLAQSECGLSLGVVMPDAFAADVQPYAIRVTLLRSPFLAYAESGTESDHAVLADRGEHEFRFRFYAGQAGFSVAPAMLETSAASLLRPPVYADLTRGMPAHRYRP